MTIMIISSIKRFMTISRILENAGITNIRFYNSTLRRMVEPIFPAVKFIDFLILGSDAYCFPYLEEILEEARRSNIPVISEDRLLQSISY